MKTLLTIGGLVLVFNEVWPNVAGCAIVLAVLAGNVVGARRAA